MSLARATAIFRIVAACWSSTGELDAVEFRHTVDEERYVGSELLLEIVEGHVGVLDDVVQQGGDQRVCVEAVGGEDLRYSERMHDVRVARAPSLTRMGLGGDRVGRTQGRDIGARMMGERDLDQVVEHLIGR